MASVGTSRARAALAHLLASGIVVACVAGVVAGLWYPGPFLGLAGGSTLLLILAGVDVVLGPMLTALVFNPAKGRRQLTVDIGVIVALQLAALGYGVWTMAAARPVVLAFEVDLFRIVGAVHVADEDLPLAPEGLRALAWTGPVLIGTDKPGGERQVEAALLGLSGVHLAMQPRYWVPFDAQRAQVWQRARPVAELPAEQVSRLAADLHPWPGSTVPALSSLRWLPLMAARVRGTVLVEPNGSPVALSAFELP